MVKNPPTNAGNARDSRNVGLIPGSERSPGEGNGNPLQSCLGNAMDRGAWRGRQEMDMTNTFPFMLVQASSKVVCGRLVRSMGTSPGPGTEMEEMTTPFIFWSFLFYWLSIAKTVFDL